MFLWDQLFNYGVSIVSGNVCWCGSSKSFPELLLSQEICVDVGVVVHFRGTYSQET
jgi:hypothetical protein